MIHFIYGLLQQAAQSILPDFLVLIALKVAIISAATLLVLAAVPRLGPAGKAWLIRLILLAVILIPLLSFIVPVIDINLPSQSSSSWPAVIVSGAAASHAQAAETATSADLSWKVWLILIWAGGMLILALRLVIGILLIGHLLRKSESMTDREYYDLRGEAGWPSRIGRKLKIVFMPRVAIPFTCGLINPHIVLPTAMRSWDKENLQMVIGHELAHINRHDLIWGRLASLVEAVYWFNPMIWIIRRKLILEADKTCDDCVLGEGISGAAYAERLLALVRESDGRPRLLHYGPALVHKAQMEERIMSILSGKIRATAVGRTFKAILMITLLLMVVPLAGLQLRAANDGAAKPDNAAVGSAEEKFPSPDEFVPADTMPEMIEDATPVYPDSAMKAKIQGVVWVKALIDKDGVVRKALLGKTSGHKILDDAALAAAWKCKFKAAIQGSQPIAVWVMYSVEFRSEPPKGDSAKSK